MECRIKTFNNIAPCAQQLLANTPHFGPDVSAPQAIILRSHPLQMSECDNTVLVVGRAGTGVNHLPLQALTEKGIVVLNTPGANANAVKELVIANMLIASRHLSKAWQHSQNLSGSDSEISKAVEKQKKQFTGQELPGKRLAVIGLGRIGVSVANAAIDLGLSVVGFDPHISIQNAWALSGQVESANDLNEALTDADFVSVHVPLNEHTQDLLNQKNLPKVKKNAVILNFARAQVVNEADMIQFLNQSQATYVCDFPSNALLQHDQAICLPHLGASTHEAADNCARMIATQTHDFLRLGHLKHCVNFPDTHLKPQGTTRLTVFNKNIPNMVASISSIFSDKNINIANMINKSKNDLAYSIFDLDNPCDPEAIQAIQKLPGVIRTRLIPLQPIKLTETST